VRRSSGFTIVEIIVVLLMISILAATVLGRSVTSTDLDLAAQTDKLRNQLRYAQAQAMKTGYTDFPFWGIESNGTEYWLFRRASPSNTDEEIRLPGMASNRVSIADSITLDPFKVYFNRMGKPFDETNSAISLAKTINITASQTRTVSIEPETGFVH
jgi:MSHA pilin protein MshC